MGGEVTGYERNSDGWVSGQRAQKEGWVPGKGGKGEREGEAKEKGKARRKDTWKEKIDGQEGGGIAKKADRLDERKKESINDQEDRMDRKEEMSAGKKARQENQEEGRMAEKDVWVGRKRSIVTKDGQVDGKEKKSGKADRETVCLEERWMNRNKNQNNKGTDTERCLLFYFFNYFCCCCFFLPKALLILLDHTSSLNDPSCLFLPSTVTLVTFSLEFFQFEYFISL